MVVNGKNSSVSINNDLIQMHLIDYLMIGHGLIIWSPIIVFIIVYSLTSFIRNARIDLIIIISMVIIVDIVQISILIIGYYKDRNVWYYRIQDANDIQSILDRISKKNTEKIHKDNGNTSSIILMLHGEKSFWSEYYWTKINKGIAIRFENAPSKEHLSEALSIIKKEYSI